MVPAHYYIPACEVAWGLFTLGTAFVKNYEQLMVMRFFVGVTATPCWIANIHIINCWYRKNELGKRNAIYYITYPLGSMFSGYLMTACLKLEGVGGLEGWRWLFIICTIITIPLAIFGVIFYPNVPTNCHSRFLTEREKELAQVRLLKEGFAPSRGISKDLVWRSASAWQTWCFFFLAGLFWLTPYPSTTPFLLWLGDTSTDKAFVNNASTITYAISIFAAMFFAFYSDWRGKRWDSMLGSGIAVLMCNIMLLVWDISKGAKYFAFILLGFTQGPINVVMAWFAESLAHDLEVRSVSFAFVNISYCLAQLILPLCVWQTKDAPRFKAGYIFVVCASVLELLILPLPVYFERRDRKRGINQVEIVSQMAEVIGFDEITREHGDVDELGSISSKGENIAKKDAAAVDVQEISGYSEKV